MLLWTGLSASLHTGLNLAYKGKDFFSYKRFLSIRNLMPSQGFFLVYGHCSPVAVSVSLQKFSQSSLKLCPPILFQAIKHCSLKLTNSFFKILFNFQLAYCLKVIVAEINAMTEATWGGKSLFGWYWKNFGQELLQGKTLEAGVDAKTMKKYCLLACPS